MIRFFLSRVTTRFSVCPTRCLEPGLPRLKQPLTIDDTHLLVAPSAAWDPYGTEILQIAQPRSRAGKTLLAPAWLRDFLCPSAGESRRQGCTHAPVELHWLRPSGRFVQSEP